MIESDDTRKRRKLSMYLSVARPDHWVKNLLVLAGGTVLLWQPEIDIGPPLPVLGRLMLAILVICLASSANYIVNEILDGSRDRIHPVKRFRPVPAKAVSIPWLWGLAGLFALLSVGISWGFLPYQSFLCVLAFILIGGVVYNVPPIRAKEVPYIDVITESANGPIRIALGWYSVTTACPPPLTFLFSCWALAAFVMTGKRHAEYRFIGSRVLAAAYRTSFRWYTERSLLGAMVGYALLSVIFFVILVMGSGLNRLLIMLPFQAVFIVWFVLLSVRTESVVREPEHIWKKPNFTIYCIGIVILFAVLAFMGG